MNRGACFAFVTLLAAGPAGTAVAQTPVERGGYLVNTIMTCHNCHTPMGPNGPQFDKALSGGLRFDEPPFDVTRPTSRPITKPASATGATPTSRRPCWRACGRAATIWPRSCRPASTRFSRPAISTPSSPICARCRRSTTRCADRSTRWTSRTRCFPAPSKPMSRGRPRRQGQTRLLSRHHRPLHGVPHAVRSARRGRRFSEFARQGRARVPRPVGHVDVAQHHLEQDEGHRRLERRRHQARHHPGRAQGRQRLKPPMGYGYYAKMTDADLDAVVAYLRTVPAKE